MIAKRIYLRDVIGVFTGRLFPPVIGSAAQKILGARVKFNVWDSDFLSSKILEVRGSFRDRFPYS